MPTLKGLLLAIATTAALLTPATTTQCGGLCPQVITALPCSGGCPQAITALPCAGGCIKSPNPWEAS